MAITKNTSKREQEQIANDEYYAGLQSVIEKDVVASKYFNPDNITYPLMEKSGEYNFGGIQVDASKGYDKTKTSLKKRGMSSLLSSQSSFKDKVKSGKNLVGIFQNPVSNEKDIAKLRVILHEVRHKAFDDPTNKEFLKLNSLSEEVFNLFLDIKTFPSLKGIIKKELDNGYELGFKGLEAKYTSAADKFVKTFDKQSRSLLNK
tara:strand:- start:49 stop:660 length:612 start_codon:yes stop_codon:yes gene_type:complete